MDYLPDGASLYFQFTQKSARRWRRGMVGIARPKEKHGNDMLIQPYYYNPNTKESVWLPPCNGLILKVGFTNSAFGN